MNENRRILGLMLLTVTPWVAAPIVAVASLFMFRGVHIPSNLAILGFAALAVAMTAFWVVHVDRAGLPSSERAVWSTLVLLGGVLGQVLYCWLKIVRGDVAARRADGGIGDVSIRWREVFRHFGEVVDADRSAHT